MTLPIPLEKDIQKGCQSLLEFLGATVIRINSGAVKSEYKGKNRFIKFNDTEGCSDLLVCLRGLFISVECKRPGSTTEPKRLAKQQKFAAKVTASGGIALTVESVKELERDLRGAGLWSIS